MRAAAASEIDAPALPPLFRHHIRRPRLTRLLDASTSRLIVLTAPAGYGKTTLAAEWLQGRPEEEVAWYYASPAAADVAALSVGMAEAVSHILPAGDRVRQRLRVPQVPDNTADILAELLAGDLMEWPENAWLVLDDYHHAMESKSAERFVEELVRLAPIRLLITTRRRPSWVTARRLVYGEVQEITQEQLSMTERETARVLNDHGQTAEIDERVTRETWPALVGLAALTSASQPPTHELESTLYRYLADEVINQAPVLERTLMLMASVPPYLDDAILVVLLDDPSPQVVSELQYQGLLLPDGRGKLRFHPLLRDVLRQRAWLVDSDRAEAIAAACFEIFLERGDWDAAFQIAVDADRADWAATVLSRAGHMLLRAGRLDTLESWIADEGHVNQGDPVALLLCGEIALRKGSFSESAAYARYALDSLGEKDPRQPAAWNLLGRALHMRCDHRAALEAYENAYQAATAGEDRFQAAWGRLIATIEIGRDEPDACVRDLENLKSTTPDHRLRLACGRMMAAERTGCRLPLKAHREALALVSHATDAMAISHAHATGIYAHARRGAYREALRLAEPAIDYCNSLRLTFPLAYCLAYRAHAEIGVRMLSAARTTLAEVEHHLRSMEDAHLQLVCETLRLKLAIAAGSLSSGMLDASSRFAVAEDVPDWPLADLIAMEALPLAARGDQDRIAESRERLSELSRGPTAEASMTLANLILKARITRDHDISSQVSEALRWIVRTQCLDSFVTAYRAWPGLLNVALTDSSLARVLRTTVRASDDLRLVAGTCLAPSMQCSEDRLTPREAEVASLLAAGLTNSEISAQLFIAHSTTKVHVRRVLKKLRAKTRLEAALTWREEESAKQR